MSNQSQQYFSNQNVGGSKFGTLKSQFGGTQSYTSVTASYSAFVSDMTIGVVTSASSLSITLPAASGVWSNKLFLIKDESGSAHVNNLTLLPRGVDTIDGTTSFVLNQKFDSVLVYSNGINRYHIAQRNPFIFTINGVIATTFNASTITSSGNVIAWRAPFNCMVIGLHGYVVSSNGSTINARKNGSSNHLGSNLSLTATDSWISATAAITNSSYSVGDKLEMMLTSISGAPTQLAFQVDFMRL